MESTPPEAAGPPVPARALADTLVRERDRIAAESRGAISTGRWMWEWFKAITTAVVLFLVVRTFLVEAFKIPTGSMENTLMVGDFLLVNKAVYGAEIPGAHTRLPAFAAPRHGDVIVFVPPHDSTKNYVKRLVGLPGDTLEMRRKVLYLDGQPQVEPYVHFIDPFADPADERMEWQEPFVLPHLVDPDREPTRDNWGPLVVPPGRYFVLGDNRDNSEDSRYWGFVDAGSLRGRPMFVYYSFRRELSPFAFMTGVRWDRIGEAIH